ncbi:MAG: AraC family transcriptional regulator ligand-binding domain-containing protein [Sphingorhabdus sp.]
MCIALANAIDLELIQTFRIADTTICMVRPPVRTMKSPVKHSPALASRSILIQEIGRASQSTLNMVEALEPSRCNEPAVIAGFARAVGRALEYKGIDSSLAFQAAGLPGDVSNAPLERLTANQINALLCVSRDFTNDPYFGLTVGRFIHISNFHALGYALMASHTLMDFCLRLERYFPIVTFAADFSVERDVDDVTLRFRPRIPLSGQSEDAFITFLLRLMRLLYDKPLKLLRIEKRHVCPDGGPQPYVEEYGIAPRFAASGASLVFEADGFDDPLYGACPDLAEQNDRIAARYLAQLRLNDVVARVRVSIMERLEDGQCTKHEVASSLGMSKALMQARLAERGYTFQHLLDETRRELVLGYLAQPDLSITEITFRLGFTDASNFTRAFRRWMGVSPTHYRHGLRAS